ncbi:MAG: sigma-70 family RNA polymerase sigma factor [Phycisphaeraceae bacterium]|nr:sigma-70 family RNA polymerase sigma factor [Phycisphaeraceae bacterium]
MSSGPISEAQAERFRRLVWPMLDMVLRTAGCLTRRADEAEDLAQEAMVKAMRAIDTYQDETNLKAWLLTILRRTHIDQLRAARNRPQTLSMNDHDFEDETQAAIGEHDPQWSQPQELMNRLEDEAVIDAMQQLPEDIRWTLLLTDVEQLDHVEAAAVLGVAVGTIKSRASRGRAMLRDRLYELARRRGWVGQTGRVTG